MQTKGGVAPPSGCDAAHVGAEARMPYIATDLFWARQLDGRLGWQSPQRKACVGPRFTTRLAVRGGQQA